jgi:hypothetical protein
MRMLNVAQLVLGSCIEAKKLCNKDTESHNAHSYGAVFSVCKWLLLCCSVYEMIGRIDPSTLDMTHLAK